MSIEDKFDEVRQLIIVGKEKGYLLYDEVSDRPAAGSHGVARRSRRAVSRRSATRASTSSTRRSPIVQRDWLEREDGETERPELDLTPGALDKTNDPVRMYLREMGTVPLLTREGEVVDRQAHRAGQALGHQVDLAHAGDHQGRHPHGRPAQGRRAHDSRARDLQRRGDHRRSHRGARAAVRPAGRCRCARRGSTSRSSTRSSSRFRRRTSASTAARSGR